MFPGTGSEEEEGCIRVRQDNGEIITKKGWSRKKAGTRPI